MCAVSFVGDHFNQKFQPYVLPNWHGAAIGSVSPIVQVPVSRVEFDALTREVEDMKALLLRAKEYDERTGQPHCEQEAKVALLRKVAEAVGVSLEDVFGA